MPPREKAVRAALKLAACKGWEKVSLQDIAREAGMPLHEMHDLFEDRCDILAAYGRMVDRAVMERAGKPGADVSPRDLLFDILMERFDVLSGDRAGVKAIAQSFKYDPKQAVISLPHIGRSMSWMLESAGVGTAGGRGAIKILGLGVVYLKTLWVWMDDESEDMAKTMAALDKNLGRAEEWAHTFGLEG